MTDSSSTCERWAVVGGGFLGAGVAAQLAERGHRVTLFESREQLGGLADGWSIDIPTLMGRESAMSSGVSDSHSPNKESASPSDQIEWDRFYHVILMSDLRLRKLLDNLGLTNDVQWRRTRTGFFTDGKLVSMSNSVEFLKFPPLGLIDKGRLALTIIIASRTKNWRALESVTVTDWLRKWSGKRTLEKIWKPLLKAKLGDLYTKTSAAFIWSTINRMYAARRSGLKEEMFGYVNGGYRVVNEQLSDYLIRQGIEVKTGVAVTSIQRQNDALLPANAGEFCVSSNVGSYDGFDKVVVSAHAPLIPKLCPQLNRNEVDCLNAVTYLGVVCVSVVLAEPLSSYYVTNITDDGVPFTGVIEMSALVDPSQLMGKGLVYLPKYVSDDDELLDRSDADITADFLAALKKMYPTLNDNDVLATRVARARHVMAVPTLDYSSKAPPVTTCVPGLYIASTAQILFGTLNVNETLLLADSVLAEIDEDTATAARGCSSDEFRALTT